MLSRLRQRSRAAFADRSAEVDLGTDVLALLRVNGIPSTPDYYGLAHMALSDRTSAAAHAVNEAEQRDGRLTREAADVILAAMAGRTPKSAAVAEGEERLRHQTLHLADLAAETVAATGQFGRDLSAGLDDLDNDAMPVDAVLTTMIERTRSSEQKLAAAVAQIDQLREEVAEARNDAMRDALTGLLNRRGVIDHVAGLDGRPRTIALCDIDAFKRINDEHGHDIGDRVLKTVAAALEQGCDPNLVGRWGGEEFIVVLDEGDPAVAVRLIDGVRAELSQRRMRARETGAHLGMISFSAGVTSLTAPLDSALREADALLYQAKQGGRNRVIGEPPVERAA